MTPVVVTLWYRAPEILLGAPTYSFPADIWSIGCILCELISGKPLFPGTSDIDQIHQIFKLLGTPTNDIWPSWETLPGSRLFSSSNSSSLSKPHRYNHLRNLFSGSGLSELALDLLNRFLLYDPAKRITATEALLHPWFKELPLPKHPSLFPTWPSLNLKPKKPAQTHSVKIQASSETDYLKDEYQKAKRGHSDSQTYNLLL